MILVTLLLGGCPSSEELAPFDFYAGEGTEWTWGVSSCVVYMRGPFESGTHARWLDDRRRLVRGGPLNGGAGTFRRGFAVDDGRLVVEEGATMRRFSYDEAGHVSEIVERAVNGTMTRMRIAYDARGRMIDRHTEQDGRAPTDEHWSYGAFGWNDAYYLAQWDGRHVRGHQVERLPSGQVASIDVWDDSRATTYAYAHADGNVATVRVTGDTSYDVSYEYDDMRRIVARTRVPSAGEGGTREELVLDDMGRALERRLLTPNGLLVSQVTYDRSVHGDVRASIDRDVDGEPDAVGDLRDECNAATRFAVFTRAYFPYFLHEGEVPHHPVPFEE